MVLYDFYDFHDFHETKSVLLSVGFWVCVGPAQPAALFRALPLRTRRHQLEHLLPALVVRVGSVVRVGFSLVRTAAGKLLELQSPLAREVRPAHALLPRLHGHAARVQIVW